MNQKSLESVISKLNEKIAEQESKSENILAFLEKSVGLCSMALMELKRVALKDGFKDSDEEIHFFKNVKPQVFHKLIYFHSLLQIELRRPKSALMQKEYLNSTLKRLNDFFQENAFMCQYYWSKNDLSDNLFFLRRQVSGYLPHHMILPFVDQEFSTLHDYTFSSIQAHEMLIKRIEGELLELQTPGASEKHKSGKHVWTDSKISLVELIYALHSVKSINNGKIDIKELMEVFESMFNIRLEEYSRTFIDIRGRKTERTKYLDLLKQNLLKRMEDADA